SSDLLKKIDVNVVVPGTLTGTVEKDINFSCENMNVTARSNFVAKVGADFSVDAGGSANVKAGSNVTLDAGANANVKAGSNVEAKAGGDLSLEAGGNFNAKGSRSEEHTSELQSRENLVCRLLLEKKKKNTKIR